MKVRLRITRLDWLMVKSFLPRLVMAFLIVLFILVMQFISMYMNEILGKGIGFEVLGKLIAYASGKLSLLALPVGVLAAALMTMGTMGENYELAAIKSTGISLLKGIRGLIILSLFLLGTSMWISFWLVPKANLKFFSLLYDVQRKKADVAIQPGYFYSDIDDYVIRVSDKDIERDMLYDVLIYDHSRKNRDSRIIIADSARTRMEFGGTVMRMILYHGSQHEEYAGRKGDRENYPYGRTYFDSLIFSFSLTGFDLDRTDERLFSRHQITLTQKGLKGAIDSLQSRHQTTRKNARDQVDRYTRIDSSWLLLETDSLNRHFVVESYEIDSLGRLLECFEHLDPLQSLNQALVEARAVKSYLEFRTRKQEEERSIERNFILEYNLRHALPVNILLFMVLGASIGAIIRRGGIGPPALISIALFLVFYVTSTYGQRFTKDGVIAPWFGAWLPVIIFTPITILVSWQASNDYKITNLPNWMPNRISKLLGRPGKKQKGEQDSFTPSDGDPVS